MPKWIARTGVIGGILIMGTLFLPSEFRPSLIVIGLFMIGLLSLSSSGFLYLQDLRGTLGIVVQEGGSVTQPRRGGDITLQGNVSAGSGAPQGRGGDANINAGTGYNGASGGNVNVGPGNYSAGNAGPGGAGGDLNIKAGDAK
jgi:hypothetical protein